MGKSFFHFIPKCCNNEIEINVTFWFYGLTSFFLKMKPFRKFHFLIANNKKSLSKMNLKGIINDIEMRLLNLF
jgi:hypothetical protein